MNQEAIEPQDELEEVLNETVEVEEPETETPEEEGKAEENVVPEEKKRNRVPAHKRIRNQRREIGERDRMIDKLMIENNNLKGVIPKEKAFEKPDVEDYDTQPEYHRALDDFYKADREAYAEQKIKERDDKVKKEKDDNQIAESNRKNAEAWAKQTASAHKADPEYKNKEADLVEDIKHLGANNLFDDIFACDNGAKIVSSLSEDYSELERLSNLSPRAAAKAIWKLDDSFSKRKKRDEPLPPPTRDRNSGRSVQRASGKPKETQKEYNIRMNGL